MAAFRGNSGWLVMARATIQSEHDLLRATLIAACDEQYNPIPSWRAVHLTQCRWNRLNHCTEEPPDILDDLLCEEEGAFYARWQREMNTDLAALYDDGQRAIESLEARATARAREVDAQIADLRRRRRLLDTTDDAYATITEIIAELESQADQEMARLAQRRAVLRRNAEATEEALWQRTDVLIEVEPMCVVRWRGHSIYTSRDVLAPEHPGAGGISLQRVHQNDLRVLERQRAHEALERARKAEAAREEALAQQVANAERKKASATPVPNGTPSKSANTELPKASPILRKLAGKILVASPKLTELRPLNAPSAPERKNDEKLQPANWSDKKIAMLRQLWSEGVSAGEIAVRLDKRIGQVMGKAHRLGLVKPAAPEGILPKPASTMPVTQAADNMNADRNDLLVKIANREELLRRYLPYTAEWFDLREAIKALRAQLTALDAGSESATPSSAAESNSWSAERVEMLKRLWLGGATANQIAKALGGTSRNAVIGKAKRLGLPLRAEIEARPRHMTETELTTDT